MAAASVAAAQTRLPGKIMLTPAERAKVAEVIRATGQYCPNASSLYDDGRQIYCTGKPEEQVRAGDRIVRYAVGLDRNARTIFVPTGQ